MGQQPVVTAQLADCYRRLYQGMTAKDGALLREVLSDTFVLTHMTGMRQDREAFIRAVQDGTLRYRAAVHEKITAAPQGAQAALSGYSMVEAAVFGGGWRTWRLALHCTLAREAGGWRFTAARAATYSHPI